MRAFFVLLVLAIFFVNFSFAASISGHVRDSAGTPVAFANVVIKGTTKGTVTNDSGFYRLHLLPGEYVLVFQHIAYKAEERKIIVAEKDIHLSIILADATLQLNEVSVTKEREDPAYAIIRKAIKNRTFYLGQVEEFSCETYSKGKMRFLYLPDSIMGKPLFDSTENKDSVFEKRDEFHKGIIYFSESVSSLFYEKPGQYRNVVHHSRVSGSNRGVSINYYFDRQFNFYNNTVTIEGLTPRGIISPIAESALVYYRYKLEGAFMENDVLVNKIKVIPKRKSDPVFSGYIYIAEDTWRIHSLNLYITRDNGMVLLDTLELNQQHFPVTDKVWAVFNQNFGFNLSFFGVRIGGTFLSMYSDYKLDEALHGLRRNEMVKFKESSLDVDTAAWLALRPVPLLEEEKTDYEVKDSIREVRSSKEYLDSLDKKFNKFNLNNFIFTGYFWRNSYEGKSLIIMPLLFMAIYNPVEGLALQPRAIYSKTDSTGNQISIDAFLRYGISNGHFNGGLSYMRNKWKLKAGKSVFQFNPWEPIPEFYNTFSALFDHENTIHLFEKAYAGASYKSELLNGLYGNAGAEVSYRWPLHNTTNYSFSNELEKNFEPNIPVPPFIDDNIYEKHYALLLNAGFDYVPAQKYMMIGSKKVNMGSKYPTLSLYHTWGVPLPGKSSQFQHLQAGVRDEINLKLLGKFSYSASAGTFFNTRPRSLADYRHFNGNEFKNIAPTGDRRFLMLPTYSHSTVSNYFEVHAEHNFQGFIFNKIPLVKRLKWNLIAGGAYLQEGNENYYEMRLGIDKLINIKGLSILRVDFAMSFDNNRWNGWGWYIRLPANFGSSSGNSVSITL